jgi:hypothetical protein
VENFLRQNEIGVLIENGGATPTPLPGTQELNDGLTAAILHDEDPAVPEEVKAIFYAKVELGVRNLPLTCETLVDLWIITQGELVPLILHPVLSAYLLKIDISNQPIDHDYDLPEEELASPAVFPAMSLLRLENHQGYPHQITIEASSDSPGACITVREVLKTIHEDMKKPSRRCEWTKLSAEERAAVDFSFRERCKTREELGQGPCRIDYLRGRDRLQILPGLSPNGEMLPAPIISEEAV